ncbi:MAG: polysaccharide deacetylase family protein [Tumebacillaceae bacterium]
MRNWKKRIAVVGACSALLLVGCSQSVSQPVPVVKPSEPTRAVAQVKRAMQGPVVPVTTRVQNSEQVIEQKKGPYHVQRGFKDIPILMYHSIAVDPNNGLMVAPKDFAAEMRHLKQAGYHTISFADLGDFLDGGKQLPEKPVIVTFDDGYKNNYTEAYPVLKQLGLKATIFVISNFVGGKNTVSWDEIQEMQDSGVFEIGAHTKDHLDLTTLKTAAMDDEIAGSKKAIEAHIGQPVTAFAYPSGRLNDAVVQETEKAGFDFAVTTRPGVASDQQGLLMLNRVRVPGNESPSAFAQEMP